VTVIRTPNASDRHDFCLMVSMNHTLGDAHTFYTISHGLGDCASTPTMSVVRKVQADLQLSLAAKRCVKSLYLGVNRRFSPAKAGPVGAVIRPAAQVFTQLAGTPLTRRVGAVRSLKSVWKRSMAWVLWRATRFGWMNNVLARGPLRYSAFHVRAEWVAAEKLRYQVRLCR
jgi:hypothetical protein